MLNKNKATVATVIFFLFQSNINAAPVNPVVYNTEKETVAQKPHIKVGNPYEINGVTYVPQEYNNYDEVLLASWYGEEFNGKETSNGEVFDMNLLTAAHPTLPMPSIVEVTNLENGKKIVVRVNDRGPFKSGRGLDLSKKAAEELGFQDVGTAQVRVRLLPEATELAKEKLVAYSQEQQAIKANMTAPVVKSEVVTVADERSETTMVVPLKSESISADSTEVTPVETNEIQFDEDVQLRVVNLSEPKDIKAYVPRGIFIQLGAYNENNTKIQNQLAGVSSLGVVSMQKVDVNGERFLRLRVGPYGSLEDASKVRKKLAELGFTSARIVVQQ